MALTCSQSDLCDPHRPVSAVVILNRNASHWPGDWLYVLFLPFSKSPLDVAIDSLKVANIMNESLTGVVYIEETQLDATFLALRYFFRGWPFLNWMSLNCFFFPLSFFFSPQKCCFRQQIGHQIRFFSVVFIRGDHFKFSINKRGFFWAEDQCSFKKKKSNCF